MTIDRQKKAMVESSDSGNAEQNKTVRIVDSIPIEVVKTEDFTDDELRSVSSFEDAVLLAEREHGSVVSADSELGNGFTLLANKNKDVLIGRPMLLISWKFNSGNHGNFVSIYLMVKNLDGSASKYIVNDGSAGICEQLATYSKRTGRRGNLLVKNGLTRSDYTFMDLDGEETPASTYYLDTSA